MRHFIHTNSVNHAGSGRFDCHNVVVDGMRFAIVQRLRLYLRGISVALRQGQDLSGRQLELFARLTAGLKRRAGLARPMLGLATLRLGWERISCSLLPGLAWCGHLTRPGVSCSFLARG